MMEFSHHCCITVTEIMLANLISGVMFLPGLSRIGSENFKHICSNICHTVPSLCKPGLIPIFNANLSIFVIIFIFISKQYIFTFNMFWETKGKMAVLVILLQARAFFARLYRYVKIYAHMSNGHL